MPPTSSICSSLSCIAGISAPGLKCSDPESRHADSPACWPRRRRQSSRGSSGASDPARRFHCAAVPATVWQLMQASRFKDVPAFGSDAGILHRRLLLILHPRRQTAPAYRHTPAAASWRARCRRTARTVPRTSLFLADRSTSRSDDSESGRSCPPVAAPRSCDPHRPKASRK